MMMIIMLSITAMIRIVTIILYWLSFNTNIQRLFSGNQVTANFVCTFSTLLSILFLCWLFHLLPTTCGTRHKASASSESQPSSLDAKTQLSHLEAGTQLTAFSQISAHASGAWCHSHRLVPFPIWNFYFDISEWHILPAHAWTPALMLHLTNPCAKQTVFSLTKPKGKIYITKSLSHYITISSQFSSIWPIDRTLSAATTPGQSGPGAMAMKRYSAFSKAPALLEPPYQII